MHRYEKKQKKKKKKDGKLPIINLCLPVSRGFYRFNLGILRFISIKAGFWPRLSTVCASFLFIISPTLSSHTTSSAGYFAGENFLIILWSGERVLERLPGQLFADGKFRPLLPSPPSFFFGTNNSDLITQKGEGERRVEIGWMEVDNLFVLSNRIIMFLATLSSNYNINCKVIFFQNFLLSNLKNWRTNI